MASSQDNIDAIESQIREKLEKFNEDVIAQNEKCKCALNELKRLIKEMTKEMCGAVECGLDKCARKGIEKKINKYKDLEKNICCNCNAGFLKMYQQQKCKEQAQCASN